MRKSRFRRLSGSAKKLLAPEQLRVAVEALAERLDQPAALVGGYALQQFGSPRLTGDLDIITTEVPTGFVLGDQLSFGGAQSHQRGVPVDFIVRSDHYVGLYEEALDHRVNISDIALPVVPPEYILAMKLAAGRSSDDADIEWMLTSDVVEVDQTEQIIRQHLGHYAADEFFMLVEEIEWLASR
ncbi:hypothetical protein LCGC14_0827990 [marine sediment metagenome]|uniref:Uncharacterized protein n=1 Tax=marine sediment metagenome TaxID=412755 RepID=A0A0F9PLJ2_9ZZZZ